MTEILSSAQMRAVEMAAIESGATSGLELMERAGAGVVGAIRDLWPEAARRVVVFCGPGNNGGDGYVIARQFARRGWQVALWAPLDPATPDAQANAQAWGAFGPIARTLDSVSLDGVIVIDALFGSGLTRPLAERFWRPLALAQAHGARIVAVDILSGLCADSGQVRAEAGYLPRGADLTVSFQTPKPGHMLLPGGTMTGVLRVADIGLGAQVAALGEGASVARDVGGGDLTRLAKRSGHKFTHGHVLVLAGGVGKGGAARLAARAALRIGAGLVTLGCPPGALIENAARLDAVMLQPIPEPKAVPRLLSDPRITACCLGPGLGVNARAAALVAAVLSARRPTVLDADALTLIARDAQLRALVHGACVLTPHGGEFARLWPELSGALSGKKMAKTDATLKAARSIGATVLFKGVDTVIATPDGAVAIHASLRDRHAPWLATAGAGDVLAGVICGLLARGFGPEDAACMGARLHVDCALAHGPGLIAEDLPEMLPRVLRQSGV